jgi:hypothetical protein
VRAEQLFEYLVGVYFHLCCMCYHTDIITLIVIGIVIVHHGSGSRCVVGKPYYEVQYECSQFSVYSRVFTE